MNIYYVIWADAINSFKKFHPQKRNWNVTLWAFISYLNSINFWVVTLWLKYFDFITIPNLER